MTELPKLEEFVISFCVTGLKHRLDFNMFCKSISENDIISPELSVILLLDTRVELLVQWLSQFIMEMDEGQLAISHSTNIPRVIRRDETLEEPFSISIVSSRLDEGWFMSRIKEKVTELCSDLIDHPVYPITLKYNISLWIAKQHREMN